MIVMARVSDERVYVVGWSVEGSVSDERVDVMGWGCGIRVSMRNTPAVSQFCCKFR